MNQILSVNPNNSRKSNKSSIHSILVVFSIILMLFGLGIASTGVYSYYKNISNKENNNLAVSSNTKPVISIERENSSKIKILVTHDKELASVKYSINNEDFIEIETNGKSEIKEDINLKPGNTEIQIIAEDINGMKASRESTFEVEQKPDIQLEQVENQIQITTQSQINIDYILYYWDNDEENAKKYTINDVKNVTLVDVLEGTHTLNIIAVDTEGNENTKVQKTKGVLKPTVKVQTNGKVFRIKASDNESLSKIEITLNSNETITEDINSKDYTKDIDLEEGENILSVKVYNVNGLSEVSKVKYTKE